MGRARSVQGGGSISSAFRSFTQSVTGSVGDHGVITQSFGSFAQTVQGWTPANLSGIQRWFNADISASLNLTTTQVNSWTDQISSTAPSAAGSARPNYTAGSGGPGGQATSALTFNGSQKLVGSGVAGGSGARSFAVVAKSSTIGTLFRTIYGPNQNLSITTTNGSPSARDVSLAGVADESDTTSNATTNWELWIVTDSGTAQALRVNGAAHSLSSNHTPGASGGNETIGANTGASTFILGSINQIWAANAVWTAAEIALLEKWVSLHTSIF